MALFEDKDRKKFLKTENDWKYEENLIQSRETQIL